MLLFHALASATGSWPSPSLPSTSAGTASLHSGQADADGGRQSRRATANTASRAVRRDIGIPPLTVHSSRVLSSPPLRGGLRRPEDRHGVADYGYSRYSIQ